MKWSFVLALVGFFCLCRSELPLPDVNLQEITVSEEADPHESTDWTYICDCRDLYTDLDTDKWEEYKRKCLGSATGPQIPNTWRIEQLYCQDSWHLYTDDLQESGGADSYAYGEHGDIVERPHEIYGPYNDIEDVDSTSEGICPFSPLPNALYFSPSKFACSWSSNEWCFEVPQNWICDPSWYWQTRYQKAAILAGLSYEDGPSLSNGIQPACHCGCGAPDPDCGAFDYYSEVLTAGAQLPLFCDSLIPKDGLVYEIDLQLGDPETQYCYSPESTCRTVPEGWYCDAWKYDQIGSRNYKRSVSGGIWSKDIECNCNCGVWDPDCDYYTDEAVDCIAPVDTEFIETDVPTDTECEESGSGEACWQINPGSPPPPPYIPPDVTTTVTTVTVSTVTVPTITLSSVSPNPPPPPPPSCGDTEPFAQCAKDPSNPEASGTCWDVPCDWVCPPRWYNEFGTGVYGPNGKPDCNCGCGAPDPDCEQESLRSYLGPRYFGLYQGTEGDTPIGWYTERKNPKEYCAVGVGQIWLAPNGWSCPARDYNEVSSENFGWNGKPDCDCDCGKVYDPDCRYEDLRHNNNSDALGLFCTPGSEDSRDFRQTCAPTINQCVVVPDEWIEYCPAKRYGQKELFNNVDSRGKIYCDCDCGGLLDPDCLYQNDKFEHPNTFGIACDDSGSDSTHSRSYCSMESGTAECKTAPEEWTCSPSYYDEVNAGIASRGKPFCDCGCGAFDTDCYNDMRVTEGFQGFGLNCDGVESEDTRQFCNAKVDSCTYAPAGWICAGTRYSEASSESFNPEIGPVCDCTCGEYDPDCGVSDLHDIRCGIEGSLAEGQYSRIIQCSASGCPACTLA